MLKYSIFLFLALTHIFIWLFVIFAFLNKKTAYYNLYYVIPIIFVIHMLPFHFINSSKKYLYPSKWREKSSDIEDGVLIGPIHKFTKNIFSNSFASPMSAQGMLILGSILSAYSLKRINFKP
tara:strand:+ start:111 stop:476 length:366 start_codon:yes stop_codon:yes gene_type:complete